MGSIRASNPVKLFLGILISDSSLIPQVEGRLIEKYGAVDLRSPVIPFNFTEYYQKEMGPSIDRIFLSFEHLIDAARLPEIKRMTNELEKEFARSWPSVSRPVNLDPGYLENSKVILASTKNFYHRIYLTSGIFAEVTMHFRNNTFQYFPWTFPDYQSADYQKFFLDLRRAYRGQLRTMCLLKREPE